MGLIRKTLSVGTAGVVKGSSKKQRTAKATLEEARRQSAELERQGAVLDGSAAAAAKTKAKSDANAAIAKAQKAALKSPTPENLERLSLAYARAGRPLGFGQTGLEGLKR